MAKKQVKSFTEKIAAGDYTIKARAPLWPPEPQRSWTNETPALHRKYQAEMAVFQKRVTIYWNKRRT